MIFSISVCGQIFIVQQGGTAFQTVPLDQHLWFTSVAIGLISIPIGVLLRSIPDELVTLDRKHQAQEKDHSLFNQNTMSTNISYQEPTFDTDEKNHNEINQDNVHWSIKIV